MITVLWCCVLKGEEKTAEENRHCHGGVIPQETFQYLMIALKWKWKRKVVREENAKMRERKSLECGLKRGRERKTCGCVALKKKKQNFWMFWGLKSICCCFLRVFIQFYILIKIIRDWKCYLREFGWFLNYFSLFCKKLNQNFNYLDIFYSFWQFLQFLRNFSSFFNWKLLIVFIKAK